MIGTHVYTLETRLNVLPFHSITSIWRRLDSRMLLSTAPLQGQVAIVTGSSSGLGKEIASELYNLGATVVIASTKTRYKLSQMTLKTSW